MTQSTYSVRPDLFSGVQVYSLEDDGLTVQIGATVKRIPYADIQSVRLITYPSVEGQHGQCTIDAGVHGKLKVRSHHFQSLGEFEDRSAGYAPFLREVCRRVHAANAEARFIWGSGGLQILWLVVLVMAALGWVAWIAVVIEGVASTWRVVSALAVLVAVSLVSVRSVRSNKVEHFDPLNPPLP